jgi:excisionase family DNA binding protein
MAMDSPSDLLTVAEVGRILSLGKSTIYRLIEQGEIESVDLGPKSKRVSRLALERFLIFRTLTPTERQAISKIKAEARERHHSE